MTHLFTSNHMRKFGAIALGLTLLTGECVAQSSSNSPANGVAINVDFKKSKGPMKPIWAFFGYDEPNYT